MEKEKLVEYLNSIKNQLPLCYQNMEEYATYSSDKETELRIINNSTLKYSQDCYPFYKSTCRMIAYEL